jgi:excisionase family DNA binding protein
MIKDKYLTTKEAALLIGFSSDYVRRLVSTGKIKAEKLGKVWLIKPSSLLKIKRQRKKKEPTHGSRID